ncbi:MAG: hypothetical protein HEP71_22745 [Roseivirga sp.]|nr:hypothetical protein [Roseivirga sp.]
MLTKKKIPVRSILIYGFLPSFLKRIVYRIKGYKLSKGVKIGIGSVIIGEDVTIGENSSVGFFTIIRAKTIKIDRFVQIGSLSYIDTERLEIGDDTRIRENVFVAGITSPKSLLKLGQRCLIGQYSFFNPSEPIVIGDDCGIGGGCKLFTHGSFLSVLDGYPVSFAPITLGSNVWIAWDVFVLPGVSIGSDVVVGARSFVTKNIPSKTLVSGNPAKVKVKNFPAPTSLQDQLEVLRNTLDEFKSFLEYNKIQCSLDTVSDGKVLEVRVKRKYSRLTYLDTKDVLRNPQNSQTIVSFYKPEGLEDLLKNSSVEMIICIESKERIGTSELGEEFAKFISKYGIRFRRSD